MWCKDISSFPYSPQEQIAVICNPKSLEMKRWRGFFISRIRSILLISLFFVRSWIGLFAQTSTFGNTWDRKVLKLIRLQEYRWAGNSSMVGLFGTIITTPFLATRAQSSIALNGSGMCSRQWRETIKSILLSRYGNLEPSPFTNFSISFGL